MKIFVAIPVYDGKLGMESICCLLAEQAMAIGLGDELMVHFAASNAGITQGRNQLAYDFMESGADRLVFLDSDVTFPPGSLIKLAHMPKDFVGGCYRYKQAEEGYPLNFLKKPNLMVDQYGLIEVEGLPTGFLALSRKVFETMREKYPEREMEHFGHKGFNYFQMPVIDGVLYGEDVFFCKEWRDLGGEIYLMHDVELTHWGYKPTPFVGHIGNWIKSRPGADVEVT